MWFSFYIMWLICIVSIVIKVVFPYFFFKRRWPLFESDILFDRYFFKNTVGIAKHIFNYCLWSKINSYRKSRCTGNDITLPNYPVPDKLIWHTDQDTHQCLVRSLCWYFIRYILDFTNNQVNIVLTGTYLCIEPQEFPFANAKPLEFIDVGSGL